MALFNQSGPRLLSRPCRVCFAGFESDTTQLQQAGWRLSAEQDIRMGRINLMMHLESADLYVICEDQRYDFRGYHEQSYRIDDSDLPVFMARKAFSRATQLRLSNFNASNWIPIDAMPQFTEQAINSIADFNIFASPLVRTEEIIIEPQSVAECLELIRKMQAPELAAVRKRNMQRDRDTPVNQSNFHAQILSLAA